MTTHSDEKQLDELLHLLEQERALSVRVGTMSEAEKGEHRDCVRRINTLVLGFAWSGEESGEA